MATDIKPKIFLDRKAAPRGQRTIDAYTGAVRELFFIRNPKFKKQTPAGEKACTEFIHTAKPAQCWIFYPEINTLVHTLSENLYFELRTARNRNIITKQEQKQYRSTVVGIAGLSVGSSVVGALTQSGGPKIMKIADFDTLEISNLNRIRAHLTDVGTNKTIIAAREVWLLDPFADLAIWPAGVTRATLRNFLTAKPRLNIFIDQMDNLALKIKARQICQQAKIPVVMATDNGDGIILDIERFDLEPNRPLFHGLIKKINPDTLGALDFKTWLKLATEIVGPEYLTEHMQSSLLEIGKTIAAVPQLGPSASLAGTAIAFAVRKIATNQAMPSGRYSINLESTLVPGYNKSQSIRRRAQATAKFKKIFT